MIHTRLLNDNRGDPGLARISKPSIFVVPLVILFLALALVAPVAASGTASGSDAGVLAGSDSCPDGAQMGASEQGSEKTGANESNPGQDPSFFPAGAEDSVFYKVTDKLGDWETFRHVYIRYTYDDGTEFTAADLASAHTATVTVPNPDHITNTTVSVVIVSAFGVGALHGYCHHIHLFTADRYVPFIDIDLESTYRVGKPDDTTVTVNGVSNTIQAGGDRDILTTKSTFGKPGAENSLVTYTYTEKLNSNDFLKRVVTTYTYDDGTKVTAADITAEDQMDYVHRYFTGILSRVVPETDHITKTSVSVTMVDTWGFSNGRYCYHLHQFTADRYVPSLEIAGDSVYRVGGPDDTTVTVGGISDTIRGGDDGGTVYGNVTTF